MCRRTVLNEPVRVLRRCALVLVFALFFTKPARAIVVTEPLFSDVTTEDNYAFLARAGLDLQQGNTRLLVLSGGLAGRARFGDHEFLLSGAVDRSTASGEAIANKSFGHQRYRYWIHDRLQWEVYGQIAQDRFRLIALRALAGTGPRFTPYASELFKWTLGLSYFYEVERLEGSVDYPDGLTRKTHRANFFSSARLDFKEITLRQIVYLQPAFSDVTNIRVLHELDGAVEVVNHFSLTWTFSQSRDSIAPSDVVPMDVRLLAGIKADF